MAAKPSPAACNLQRADNSYTQPRLAAVLILRRERSAMACMMHKSAAFTQTAGRSAPSRRVVSCHAMSPVRQQASPMQSAMQHMGSTLAASVLAASLVLAPATAVQAADMRTLADVTRDQFSFVDQNKDGIVTKAEISELAQQIAQEQEFDAPRDNLLNFTVRLFDLNQDGKLTTDEVLTAVALDSAVAGDSLNADVYKVFDSNNDGAVSMAEWKAPFGNLGQNGEELKEYTFNRVEYLSNGDGKLDAAELANALTLMRVQVLGY